MCGIAGILRFDGQPVERDRLLAMQAQLACRGPDASGIYTDGPLGFVHTRLAVLDPARGQQPMTLPGRKLTVVFNGEIYNHRELRRELEAAGHRFSSDHSDTEVLLHGYREWFDELTVKLRGMFAFALWDGEELILARDSVGKKPLYFWASENEVIFASTIAALRAAMPGQVGVDRDMLWQYLSYGYTLGQGLCQGVREMPPYMVLRISPRPGDKPEPPRGISNIPADAERFMQLLAEAVNLRLESDVPLGCFLSGGIDSSLIAAIAQRKLQQDGRRLQTFSVSMPEASYDEAPWARLVAEHIGAEHHELRAEPHVEQDLRSLIASMGEPLADSSILPTYWLSRLTRQHVTVALSGDGGDELFGGYERYVALRVLRRHAWWLRKIPATRLTGEQKSRSARLKRMVEAARFGDEAQRYASLVRIFNDQQLRDLGLNASNVEPLTFDRDDLDDPADLARWWDFTHYLPGDLLRKVDRASMAVGLEVRCPMLDQKLVEAALSTPMKMLMPGRRTKEMLRQIARPFLPADVIERKKMGFAVPIGRWFAGPLRPMLQRWLLDEPYLASLDLRRDFIERLIREHGEAGVDHNHRLFALLSLAMWLEWAKK